MSYILSKEFIFSILLLSGTLKAILPLIGLAGIPDITLLSALVVSLIMFRDMKETLLSLDHNRVELLGIIIFFYLFIMYSLSYSSSMDASITKTINFGTMVLAFIFPLLVKEFNIKKFMIISTIIIFLLSIVFFNFYTAYLNRDVSILLSIGKETALHLTALYLTISWLNGIVILYYFFQKIISPYLKWSILIIAFIFILSAGGRGPLIFTLLILGAYVLLELFNTLLTFKINKLMIPILIMLTLATSTIMIVSSVKLEQYNKSLKLVDNTVERLMEFTNTNDGGASAHSRIVNAKFSIKKINEAPFFGYGIGSYGYEKNHIDELDYPHNIFLEVWFELGFLPLLLFMLLFYKVYKNINPSQSPWALALFFFFLLNLLKSSSLIDIRMMLGFYAMFITIESYKQSTN